MQHLMNEGVHSFLSTIVISIYTSDSKGSDLPFQGDASLISESLPEVRCRPLAEDVKKIDRQ